MPSSAQVSATVPTTPAASSSIDDGLLVGRVRDAEAAAEVQLGHRAAGEQVAVHGEQAAGRLREAARRRRSGSRCGCAGRGGAARAGRGSRRRSRAPASGRRRTSGPRGRSRGTRACEACTPLFTRSRTAWTRPAPAGGVGDAADLLRGVEHDRADAGLDRGRAARRRTCRCRAGRGTVAGHARGEGERELSAGRDVEAQALVAHPAGHVGGEERLRGVVDVRVRAEVRGPRRGTRRGRGGRGGAPRPRRGRTAGVPCRSARSASATPPTSMRPASSRRVLDGQTWAASAWGSAAAAARRAGASGFGVITGGSRGSNRSVTPPARSPRRCATRPNPRAWAQGERIRHDP